MKIPRILLLILAIGTLSTSHSGQLLNLATRGYVDSSGKKLYAGVVVIGQSPKQVVVRAKGPSLPIPNPLRDPKLTVYDGVGQPIASNDDWEQHPSAARVEATGNQPQHEKEPAIAITFPPGKYTIIVESSDGASGDAVVSVTDLSPTGEDPFILTDLSGVWQMTMQSASPASECTSSQGYLLLRDDPWIEDRYLIVLDNSYVSADDGGAPQYKITGVAESGLVSMSGSIIEGVSSSGATLGTRIFDANGLITGLVASGQWTDVNGCHGSWRAYKQ